MLSSSLALLAQAAQTLPPDDDFSLFLFVLMLLALAACLILLGIGLVVGFVCVAGVAALATLGIVSASALVAVWQRRFSAGLRAFHYQFCAAVTLPGGVALLWIGTSLFDLHLRHRYILLLGAVAGAAAGLLLAAILDWTGRLAYRRLLLAIPSSLSDRPGV